MMQNCIPIVKEHANRLESPFLPINGNRLLLELASKGILGT